MRPSFKYGDIRFDGAKAGDRVRFVDSPIATRGAILFPRNPNEENALLVRVEGTRGYVELRPRKVSAVTAESGSASAVTVALPITVGGSLKIS